MTAAAVPGLVVGAETLLGDYLDHVAGLGLGERAVRDRTRIARDATRIWLPAAQRAAELRSSGAWPLVCYAIGTDRIQLDVELVAVKQLTGLGSTVEARDPAGFAAIRGAGNRLGWSSSWAWQSYCLARRADRRPHRAVDREVRHHPVGELDSAVVAARLPGPVGQPAAATV